MTDLANTTLLSSLQLSRLLNISRMSVTRWRRCGKLPAPVHVDPHSGACLWSSDDINAWLSVGQPVCDPERAAEAGPEACRKATVDGPAIDAKLDDLFNKIDSLPPDAQEQMRDLFERRFELMKQMERILARADARTDTPIGALRAERRKLQEGN